MNQKIVMTIVAFIAVQSLYTFGCFAQIEDVQNENESNGETGISLDLPSLFPIVGMMKSQIKEIVIDLATQVFQFLRAIVQDIKVRLLKRLGKYTLSDCFHLIFDGVVEFVNEESSQSNDSEFSTQTTIKIAATEKTTTEMVATEKTTSGMAVTEKNTSKMADTEKSTTEMATIEMTPTTTTTTEAPKNENYSSNSGPSIYYGNPYMWYYK